jgi:hypothetical protein
MPTVVRMSVSNGAGTPKMTPRHEAEARLLRENIGSLIGEPATGRKTLSDWQSWKTMRRNRIDCAPCYWNPRSLWSE